jgi:hypothetical protein
MPLLSQKIQKATERFVALAKAEILEDARQTIGIYTATDFATLHNFVDANEYGAEAYEELSQRAQAQVWDDGTLELNEWIRSGKMREEARQMIEAAERVTLPPTHEKAYSTPEDSVRCSNCGHLPEPCEECKRGAKVLNAMNAERSAR